MSRYDITIIYKNDDKFNFDSNATMGYDEGLSTWFVQGFEYTDNDGNDMLALWRGTKHKEFDRLEYLLNSFDKNQFTFLTEKNQNLYDFFPSSDSHLSNLFIFHLNTWAKLDRQYTENPKYSEINFNDYIKNYEDETESADYFTENFARNIAPEDLEILREVFYSYSNLFKNNIECACVRSVMNQNWNGIHGWMK